MCFTLLFRHDTSRNLDDLKSPNFTLVHAAGQRDQWAAEGIGSKIITTWPPSVLLLQYDEMKYIVCEIDEK